MQIVILGAHRSGTSLVTRLVNMMGAYFSSSENTIGFAAENPKGFWERKDVMDYNNVILEELNTSWDELSDWKMITKYQNIPLKNRSNLENNDVNIKETLVELNANIPWVVKDPRLALTYPAWKQHLDKPIIIYVWRNPMEVATSLKTRNGFSIAHGLAIWEYYNASIINNLQDATYITVSHSEVLADPIMAVKKIYEKLKDGNVEGLKMPSDKEITTFIEPNLYRSKVSDEDSAACLSGANKDILDIIQGKKSLPKNKIEPSFLAVNEMENYRNILLKEAKSKKTNEEYAATEQERVNLEIELEDIQNKLTEVASCIAQNEDALTNYEKVKQDLEKVRADFSQYDHNIKSVYNSNSWKIGHTIVKILRILTFKGVSTV